MKRICAVIDVKPEKISEYERVHAQVWPHVLATLTRANVKNYSIYRHGNLLISYMEYVGTDYEADFVEISVDGVGVLTNFVVVNPESPTQEVVQY